MLAFALLLALAQDRTSSLPPGPDDGTPPAPARCGEATDGITVCGNADQSRFRLRRTEPRYEPRPLRPNFTLPGGGTGTVEAVQRGVGGVSVPSAMVTLKIPLGGKKKPRQPEDK